MSASVKGFGCRPVRDGSDAAVGPAFESLQRRKPRYDEAPAPGKRDNPLPLLPELLDPKSHHIAGLQKTRRFHSHADPRRGAGRDDIAGQKRHALAQIAHELRAIEDHRACAAALHALAVHIEPHVKVVHVAHFIFGHEVWAHRTKGIEALALIPLPAALKLIVPLRYVINNTITRDIVQGFVDTDVLRF